MERVGRRRKRPRRNWVAIIEAQMASGQTAGVYCREHDIPYKSFLYNRRKFRRREAVLQTAACHEGAAKGFVSVSVSKPPQVVLRLSSGLTLESDRLPEAGWLIELTRGLSGVGEVPC